MRTYKDKSLILKRIKEHYKFNTDVEFAEFLGIAKTTLSSWYARGTIDYDLVYSKCVGIDGNFLLSGEGKVIRNKDEPINQSNTYNKKESELNEVFDSLRKTIKAQEITIESQRETIATLKQIIAIKRPEPQKGTYDPTGAV